ncbi:adenylate kinase [Pseudokineococcus basanitobsidens]|uniref:Adenylate kinase n=1 Tax=Pseudokineococcus basanitobsidens TaxID=1926649 RepID=A0ABU8RH58_9ACTN
MLVLLGPPGAGKGTQAARLAVELDVPAISTGDIFRANVSEGTELGRTAQSYMDEGEYVPDAVTNAMVRDRLGAEDAAEGFLLDGYPRTPAQVDELDAMLAAAGAGLDCVVQLTVDTDEVVKRLAQRAGEQHRSDDGEAVQRHRLEVYEAQTAPLVDVYARRGLLRPVDGMGPVPEVTGRVLAALGRG